MPFISFTDSCTHPYDELLLAMCVSFTGNAHKYRVYADEIRELTNFRVSPSKFITASIHGFCGAVWCATSLSLSFECLSLSQSCCRMCESRSCSATRPRVSMVALNAHVSTNGKSCTESASTSVLVCSLRMLKSFLTILNLIFGISVESSVARTNSSLRSDSSTTTWTWRFSGTFPVTKTVKQGCLPALSLFRIMLSDILSHVFCNDDETTINYGNADRSYLHETVKTPPRTRTHTHGHAHAYTYARTQTHKKTMDENRFLTYT